MRGETPQDLPSAAPRHGAKATTAKKYKASTTRGVQPLTRPGGASPAAAGAGAGGSRAEGRALRGAGRGGPGRPSPTWSRPAVREEEVGAREERKPAPPPAREAAAEPAATTVSAGQGRAAGAASRRRERGAARRGCGRRGRGPPQPQGLGVGGRQLAASRWVYSFRGSPVWAPAPARRGQGRAGERRGGFGVLRGCAWESPRNAPFLLEEAEEEAGKRRAEDLPLCW